MARLTLTDWPELKRYAEELALCARNKKEAMEHYAGTQAAQMLHELNVTKALDAVKRADEEHREARMMFYRMVNEMTDAEDEEPSEDLPRLTHKAD